MAHRFDPAHLGHLDSPLRRLLLPQGRILKRIGVKEGDVFLDIGAGAGYFSFPAAEIVGEGGLVYAIDIEPEAVRLLNEKREALGKRNVQVRQSTEKELGVPPGSGTVALLFTVLHEVDDKAGLLRSILHSLKEGGRLVVVEFRKEALLLGPPKSERISKEELQALLEVAGCHDIRFEPLNASLYIAAAVK